jgi:hypothetical protein
MKGVSKWIRWGGRAIIHRNCSSVLGDRMLALAYVFSSTSDNYLFLARFVDWFMLLRTGVLQLHLDLMCVSTLHVVRVEKLLLDWSQCYTSGYFVFFFHFDLTFWMFMGCSNFNSFVVVCCERNNLGFQVKFERVLWAHFSVEPNCLSRSNFYSPDLYLKGWTRHSISFAISTSSSRVIIISSTYTIRIVIFYSKCLQRNVWSPLHWRYPIPHKSCLNLSNLACVDYFRPYSDFFGLPHFPFSFRCEKSRWHLHIHLFM